MVFGHNRPTAPFDGAVQEGDGKVEASSLTAAVASAILWARTNSEKTSDRTA